MIRLHTITQRLTFALSTTAPDRIQIKCYCLSLFQSIVTNVSNNLSRRVFMKGKCLSFD